MRSSWAALAIFGLAAGPVMAQGLIPPSRSYSEAPTSHLDKNFGLPTFGMTPELPQQKTQAEKPAPNSGSADFFQAPQGLNSPDTPAPDANADRTPDTPDFFAGTSGVTLPKVATSGSDTPLYTTGDGSMTGGTPASGSKSLYGSSTGMGYGDTTDTTTDGTDDAGGGTGTNDQ